jgi:tryptophanase
MAGLAGLGPGCDGFDVGFGDGATVFKTQQVFQEDLQRVGQLGGAVEAVLLGLFQEMRLSALSQRIRNSRQAGNECDKTSVKTCDISALDPWAK